MKLKNKNQQSSKNSSSSIPQFAAFQVTGKCNWNCYFCFSRKNIPDMNTRKCKAVIKKLAEAGVKIISLAGREPFLRDDVLELMNYIKTCGCQAVIETNGSLLSKKILKQLKADWLSFSIDSINPKTCKLIGRGYLNKRKIWEIIKNAKKAGINTKVNTVVSRININELENIGKTLSFYPPTIWKLRQFTAREDAIKFKDKFFISTKDFYSVFSNICKQFPKLKIESKDTFEQSKTCFMIWPDGRIVVPQGKTHRIIGSVLKDSISDVWKKSNFNQDTHYKNIKKTYD